MAATKSQGREFTLFMVGLTAVCAGIAFFRSGAGKVALVAGRSRPDRIPLGVLQDQAPRRQDRRRRATRRHEADRRGGGAGRLVVCALWIAPDGQRRSANGDLDCGVCHLPCRNLLRACAGGEQERNLESLIALPRLSPDTINAIDDQPNHGAESMRIVRLATWTCALAIFLMAGAAIVARADAAPSASAAELKNALAAAPTTSTLANGDPGGVLTGTVNDVPVADPKAGLGLGRRGQSGWPEQDRHQLCLDTGHRLPGHVHAGRIRHG